jgi:nicotinate-nucleotide pyrophosphorylase
MSQTFEFYEERVRHAQAEADRAVLDNVRERELRSARAWREMADRARLIEAGRIKADAIRAERRAAELEAAACAQPASIEHSWR